LVKETYPEEFAYKLLEELRETIYAKFPKVKEPDSTEDIKGVRIFVSDICQRYNSMVPASQSAEENENEQIAERRAQEFAEKLKQNMDHVMIPVEETKEIEGKIESQIVKETAQVFDVRERMKDENVGTKRKALMVIFILACLIYVLTGIIYEFI